MQNPRKLCVERARSLIGAKWRHQGRTEWAVDCIGLMIKAVEAGGITMKDRTDYGREPWKSGLETELFNHFGNMFPFELAEPGDVALIGWPEQPAPAHVGIIADSANTGLSVIHSFSKGTRKVCEQDIDDEMKNMIIGVYKPWPSQQ